MPGPRQAGKTTLARQVMEELECPAHYASADETTLRDRTWLEQQWDAARLKARNGKSGALLVLDEIQKVPGWPDLVKFLWDADTHAQLPLKVLLLGSSPLLIQSGLTQSLAGRFEIIAVTYWRDRNLEVDFVLHRGKTTVGIEVKSSRRRESLAGMEAFANQFKPRRKLLVGGQGIPLEEFLSQPTEYWLQ